ncbi:MAG: superoxide dismutase [Nostoc sp. ChiSLP02]|nr:superoxide dismutase [Nostoc sp. DedSLP05]MDZ8103215.1 superoxide dismutase [Nostoc sp. DedSLP01]MDZ8188034.1 superoxide dismutase [Nostoc sp. ChiSLP02]
MIRFWRKTRIFVFTTIVLAILLISHNLVPKVEAQPPITVAANNLLEPQAATPPVDDSRVAVTYRSLLNVASPNRSLSASPAVLPPLPYSYGGLTKAIDMETMKLHHDAHHAAYVNNLNDALKQYPYLQRRSVEQLLLNLDLVPESIRTKVRNNAGGHLNHTIFWQLMSPQGGGQPTGGLAQEINKTFGSFNAFKKEFEAAGAARFGSGWVWLVRNRQNQLQIVSTPNQDSPIMDGSYPIMGNDVWEHAYYLKYRNRRAEYLSNWWNVVNWPQIHRRWQDSLQ